MIRTILLVILIAFIGVFVGLNWTQTCSLSYGLGVVKVPMLLLAAGAFVVGVIFTLLMVVSAKLSKRRKLKAARAVMAVQPAANEAAGISQG
jgi:uncharacterized integral membrane protein